MGHEIIKSLEHKITRTRREIQWKFIEIQWKLSRHSTQSVGVEDPRFKESGEIKKLRSCEVGPPGGPTSKKKDKREIACSQCFASPTTWW